MNRVRVKSRSIELRPEERYNSAAVLNLSCVRRQPLVKRALRKLLDG